MELSINNRRMLRFVIQSSIFLGIMVLGSMMIGLGKGGFNIDEILKQFFFYTGPAVGFLLGLFFVYIAELIIKKGDEKYGGSLSYSDPGELPGLPFKFLKDPFKLLLLSLIVFTILGLFAAFYPRQSFTGVGSMPQQFTTVDSILYNFTLIPAAENFGAAFFWALVIFGWRHFCRKKNINKWSFIIVAILLAVLVFGTYGIVNHLMRYGTSDIAKTNVIMFWSLGGLITVLTGSFIPFWVMHGDNNLFYDLAIKNFANDMVRNWTVGIVILMIIIFILLYVRRKKIPK